MRHIAAALIVGLALQGAASADTIELQNGDKLEGVVVVEETDDVVVVEHPVLGRIEVPKAEIKPPPEEKVEPGLFGTSILEGWKKSLSAGFAGSAGVTQSNNINADLGLGEETEHHRDAFTSKFYFASSDGDTSAQEFTASHLHDFLFTDTKWLAFVGAGYKYDRFQDWVARFVGSAGAGYDILNDDVYKLTVRSGPGFTFTVGDRRGPLASTKGAQEFRPDPERKNLNAVVEANFQWVMTDGITFTSAAAAFPVLNDPGEIRTTSQAELKIAIGMIEGLGFKIGGSYEYDSQNDNPNDAKYYGNLVYDF